MRNEVVTIFGGTGFIGRYVVRNLAARGAIIRVATRSPNAIARLRPMGDVGQIVAARWRPDEPATVDALLDGADLAVNCVGILFERREGDFTRLQAELPGIIGKAATAHGVRRVVQLSAIGADAASRSVYARTKAEGEAALRREFPGATILRPSIVFGPEDGFFNRFAAMATLSPALPLPGGGTTLFQPVYVADVARAVMAALERDDAVGRTFELGGPEVRSFEQLLRYLLNILGRRRLLLPLPEGLASLVARIFAFLPEPPLTQDQLELLKRDNVVVAGAPTLADLGVVPTPMDTVVPAYLKPFCRQTEVFAREHARDSKAAG